MKKIISAILAAILAATLSGCSSTDNSSSESALLTSGESETATLSGGDTAEISNLDYKNAAIIENTPSDGQWKKFSYKTQYLCKESSDKMVNFASSYGLDIPKDDIILEALIEKDGIEKSEYMPLSEYDAYIESAGVEYNPFYRMIYLSDDFFMEVQAFTGGMVEFDNRKNVNSVLKADFNEMGVWRPYIFDKGHKSINPNDETAACILDGKTIKVVDAIKNAEKYVLENNILFPQNFGARVNPGSISVYKYENTDNQALAFDFEYMIDGVVLEGSKVYSLLKDDEKTRYNAFANTVECTMLTENTIDWIWFPTVDGATEFTSENCEIKLGYEEAAEFLSKELSQEYVFNIEEIQLMYTAERTDDPDIACIEPVWRFYITGIEAQEYSRLYAYVSALTGEVQLAQVMS